MRKENNLNRVSSCRIQEKNTAGFIFVKSSANQGGKGRVEAGVGGGGQVQNDPISHLF